MPDQATQRITIDAPVGRCFEVATDFESYPAWARDVKEARVLAKDDDGRPHEVAFRAAALGRSARYTLRYDYTGSPNRLSWELVDGDIMRRLDGTYEFSAAGDGGTEVTYHLAVELVIPLPGFVKRRAETIIMRTALDSLKQHVEAS